MLIWGWDSISELGNDAERMSAERPRDRSIEERGVLEARGSICGLMGLLDCLGGRI